MDPLCQPLRTRREPGRSPMMSIRRVTRPLLLTGVVTGMSVVGSTAALAYPAPPDPDPAVLPPPEDVTAASSHHALVWSLTGLSIFLFLALVMVATVLLINRRRRSHRP